MRPLAVPHLPLYSQCLEWCPDQVGSQSVCCQMILSPVMFALHGAAALFFLHSIWNLDHFANFRVYTCLFPLSLLNICLPIFLSSLLLTFCLQLPLCYNYTQLKTGATFHWFWCQCFEWQLHVENFEPPAISLFALKKKNTHLLPESTG